MKQSPETTTNGTFSRTSRTKKCCNLLIKLRHTYVHENLSRKDKEKSCQLEQVDLFRTPERSFVFKITELQFLNTSFVLRTIHVPLSFIKPTNFEWNGKLLQLSGSITLFHINSYLIMLILNHLFCMCISMAMIRVAWWVQTHII